MDHYLKVQSGFSNYILSSLLYPGSYIYLESVKNESGYPDYPVEWIGGFGESSKVLSENRQIYKVKIDFRGIKLINFNEMSVSILC